MSQGALVRHLGLEEEIERDYISKFERGILEPTLNVLLAYARELSLSKYVPSSQLIVVLESKKQASSFRLQPC